MRQDLNNSGLFRILDPATYIDTLPQSLDTLHYQNWAAIGTVGVIIGQHQPGVGRHATGRRIGVARCAQQQSRLVGKEYRLSRSRYREVAHRFSDVVYQAFTGEGGPFNTQVVCVRPPGRSGLGSRGKDIVRMDYDGREVERFGGRWYVEFAACSVLGWSVLRVYVLSGWLSEYLYTRDRNG